MSPGSPLPFLALRTAANRAAARLRRLRRPRYLLFALVGGSYFYFFVLRHWITGMRMASRADFGTIPPDLAEVAAGLVLIVVAALAWCLAAPPSALPFTEPEVQFLFPAPLSRRALLGWKMAGTVPGALIGALFFSLGAGPLLAPGAWGSFLAGSCVVFVAARFHVLGVRLARFRLEAAGVRWLARALAAVGLLVLVVGAAVKASLSMAGPPPMEASGAVAGGQRLLAWGENLAAAWPLQAVTAPGRWLARPALAGGWPAFMSWLPAAMALLLLNVLWVLRSRADLQEGALEAAGEMQTARRMRAERRSGAGRVRVTRPPFRLSASASPLTALVWKSLVRMTRQVGGLQTLLVITLAVMSPVIVLVASGEARRAPQLVGGLCAALAGMLLLIGPGIFRADFAGELRHVEMLRGCPIRGHTLVTGALVGPVAVMTIYQWALLLAALVLAGPSLPGGFSAAGIVLAAALLAPPVNLASALVQNALVLLLPGWMTPGASRPSGIESMGLNIVSALARLLALSLCFLPAALVFALVLLAGIATGFTLTGLVAAGAAAAGVVLAETAIGIWWLGMYLDRFDPATELDSAAR